MRYLWQVPIRMHGDRLEAAIGKEPHTALDATVRATLHDMGCLDAPSWRGPHFFERAKHAGP